MLIIFTHELPGTLGMGEGVREFIKSMPEMPHPTLRNIENLQLKSSEIKQDISMDRVYGSMSTRSIYFAWDLPFVPAIGWQFCPPATMHGVGEGLSSITDIYFGSGDTILCQYQ